MRSIVELPISEPMYSTYHYQGNGCAVLYNNPTVRNWYLNESFILKCNKKFLEGYTSPDIMILKSEWYENPHFEKLFHSTKFTKGYINHIIRELLDNGFYVCFYNVDDYFIEGKSWYKQRHFNHDGLIFGYDQHKKTYSIFAYDTNWVYSKFKTPQKAFNSGLSYAEKHGDDGEICGIKSTDRKIELEPYTIKDKMSEYLNISYESKTSDTDVVLGIRVHDYIAMYLDKLIDGSVPHERTDRRVFRQIWEHKKVMHERLTAVENVLKMSSEISTSYAPLVDEANTMRMLYASHCVKSRMSIIPTIKKKLINIRETEQRLLENFTNKMERELK